MVPGRKAINYRMSPDNLPCLTAAGVDCLRDRQQSRPRLGAGRIARNAQGLERAGIKTVGAGRSLEEAVAPAIMQLPDERRALVYAFACASSGVPDQCAATCDRPGVNVVDDFSEAAIDRLAARMARERQWTT
jgi:poly-gamma-glutamate synthesis protein (capsule biosynthesis protein)